MEKALWYLLVGTRGGKNRARIIRSLLERPRNPNQFAEQLELDYSTVRHHLDTLEDHDVVEASGDEYGAVFFVTDRFGHYLCQRERPTLPVRWECSDKWRNRALNRAGVNRVRANEAPTAYRRSRVSNCSFT